jgi:hypothetical protein
MQQRRAHRPHGPTPRSDGRATRERPSPPRPEVGEPVPGQARFLPYVPPPSPEGLIYYSRKGGDPDADTGAKPDSNVLVK